MQRRLDRAAVGEGMAVAEMLGVLRVAAAAMAVAAIIVAEVTVVARGMEVGPARLRSRLSTFVLLRLYGGTMGRLLTLMTTIINVVLCRGGANARRADGRGSRN